MTQYGTVYMVLVNCVIIGSGNDLLPVGFQAINHLNQSYLIVN